MKKHYHAGKAAGLTGDFYFLDNVSCYQAGAALPMFELKWDTVKIVFKIPAQILDEKVDGGT